MLFADINCYNYISSHKSVNFSIGSSSSDLRIYDAIKSLPIAFLNVDDMFQLCRCNQGLLSSLKYGLVTLSSSFNSKCTQSICLLELLFQNA